ncbi:pre-rRNA-processing protein TSR1 homolog [Anopheles moucheti]|uniref:pre-rRNA-processing protein TSR1 homolog n=1 Tax=Anopheles moucheti TaxID=186751 RepID=UPI0022F0B9AA|nr:pre-rRNA-processing protein TSR1 homolog [Anopheles moucheti]
MAIETIHRPGALKQTNKSHKHGKHTSKRELERLAKGKVNLKTLTRRPNRQQSRDERRQQAVQLRKNKRQEAIALKRAIGGALTAPFLTCVLPLNVMIDPNSALAFIQGCDPEATVTKVSERIRYMNVPRFRQRFSFVVPEVGHGRELNVLDTLKVCDSVVLLLTAAAGDSDEMIDKFGAKVLNMALTQGLPTPMVCLMDLQSINPKKRTQTKANIQKVVSSILPDEKLMELEKLTDGLNLLRRIGGQKRRVMHNRSNRPHMLGEKVEYVANVPEAGQDRPMGTLKVTGFLRGVPLSVNQLVHIPGLGDFQLQQITSPTDPYRMRKLEDGEMSSAEERAPIVADTQLQTTLQRENIPNEMDAEQTWPTEEEIAASRDENKKKIIKRVPKGMSDYQASWIPDIVEEDEDDDDEDDDEDDDDEEHMSCESDTESKVGDRDSEDDSNQFDQISVSDDGPVSADRYDKEIDMEEERATLAMIQAAKVDEIFPDEIDTPADKPARERFMKYRGLESFRSSPWNVKENLPFDYARVYQFKNFDHTKRRIVREAQQKEGDDVAMPGWYVQLHVQNVPQEAWSAYLSTGNGERLIVYGMLSYEHQMSVMNVCLKRTQNSTIPIKSKERLIVQCGYRRFIVNPIYSQHTNGDKHKYERYFRTGMTVVATFFAPIQFPPSPILCFRENPDTSLSMVASGSLLSCNPDRVVLKRVVLSGHPFKINRESATIRFMFFNPEDIAYFKPCKLRTKLGRVGHIKESLGTHGHMKCVFDSQLKSHDTVLLYLYKRVFPKWTYEDCIVSCRPDGDRESACSTSKSERSVTFKAKVEMMQE